MSKLRWLRRGALGVLVWGLGACATSSLPPPPPLPREEMPYFWPYPGVPEPKWPEAHPEAKFREGMTREQYFQRLCELESGEFVYKTVDDVESLYFVRMHGKPNERAMRDRFALEDPYNLISGLEWYLAVGFALGDNRPRIAEDGTTVILTKKNAYRFIEAPRPYFERGRGIPHAQTLYHWSELAALSADELARTYQPGQDAYLWYRTRPRGGVGHFVRIERNPEDVVHKVSWQRPTPRKPGIAFYSHANWLDVTTTDKVTSRYGLVWRGIDRPGAREVILLDLHSNEILAVSRGFVLAGRVPRWMDTGREVGWMSMRRCPRVELPNGDVLGVAIWDFIPKVLKPREFQLPPPVEDPPQLGPATVPPADPARTPGPPLETTTSTTPG